MTKGVLNLVPVPESVSVDREYTSVLSENFDNIGYFLNQLLGEPAATATAATVQPFAHLTKSTTQNVGGADGTKTYVTWQAAIASLDVTYSGSQVTVPEDGRYSLTFSVSAEQGGSSRTTLKGYYRVNGSTEVTRGAARNYSRGSAYGDISVNINTELELTAADYIEVCIEVEDTDAVYTLNTFNSDCELIIRKIGD